MRYANLRLEDINLSENSVDFQIEATNELIVMVNDIRKVLGNADLVEFGADNDVYYNFYLECKPDDCHVRIFAICNNGELDDYEAYELPMTTEEKECLTFKIIKELIREEV